MVSIYAGTQGYCDKLPVESLKQYEQELHRHIEDKHPQIFEDIRTKKEITKELGSKLNDVLAAFTRDFAASLGQ